MCRLELPRELLDGPDEGVELLELGRFLSSGEELGVAVVPVLIRHVLLRGRPNGSHVENDGRLSLVRSGHFQFGRLCWRRGLWVSTQDAVDGAACAAFLAIEHRPADAAACRQQHRRRDPLELGLWLTQLPDRCVRSGCCRGTSQRLLDARTRGGARRVHPARLGRARVDVR